MDPNLVPSIPRFLVGTAKQIARTHKTLFNWYYPVVSLLKSLSSNFDPLFPRTLSFHIFNTVVRADHPQLRRVMSSPRRQRRPPLLCAAALTHRPTV